eukprot:TRINITY_DN10073_c1_g2_i2.p1 TRINITY_DN10073_c1_g2~~TRINITY_DN10073_c1_g2_i2.p1  ORF type:complete len:146 (+),score=0.91 TRINITY_DN10073_c1_g2_i2:250-687(+)
MLKAAAPHACVRASLKSINNLRHTTGTCVILLSLNSVQPNKYNKYAVVAFVMCSFGSASDTSPNSSLSHSILIDNPALILTHHVCLGVSLLCICQPFDQYGSTCHRNPKDGANVIQSDGHLTKWHVESISRAATFPQMLALHSYW